MLLLIDRSGSMYDEWGAVRRSVDALLVAHPEVRFGFLAFHGSSGNHPLVSPIPSFPQTEAELDRWFVNNTPTGGTPLGPALVQVAQRADRLWSLNVGWLNHFLIVLSDGEGNVCAPHNLPIPQPPANSCLRDDIAAGGAWLLNEHDVRTFAIGYRFQGVPDQLLALVEQGGMSYQGFVLAGDEATLTTALQALFADPTLCQ